MLWIATYFMLMARGLAALVTLGFGNLLILLKRASTSLGRLDRVEITLCLVLLFFMSLAVHAALKPKHRVSFKGATLGRTIKQAPDLHQVGHPCW